MAMTDDLLRIMGFGQSQDDNAEVNIKIKPLGNIAQNAAAGVQSMNAPSEPTSAGLSSGGGGASDPSSGGGNPQLTQRPGAPSGPPNYLTDPYGMPGMIPPGTNFGSPGGTIGDKTFGRTPGSDLYGNAIQQIFGGRMPETDVTPGQLPTGPFFEDPMPVMTAGGPALAATPSQPGPSPTAPTSPGTTGGFGAGGASIVDPAHRVQNKPPSLVTHPLGKYTDDAYEAAIAQLQFETQSQYLKLLQDLGWMDANGNFIPGLLETEAVRRRDDLNFQRENALQDVNDAARRGSTAFSGKRATNLAKAQRPFDAQLGNLETTLGRELSARYAGLGDLTRGFELQRNLLLSEAAARLQASLLSGPVGDDGGIGPTGTGRNPSLAAISQYAGDIDALKRNQGEGRMVQPAGSLGLAIGAGYNGVRVTAPPQAPNAQRIIVTSGPNPTIIGYIDASGNFVPWNGGRLGGGGSSGGGSRPPSGGGGGPLRTQ